MKELEKEKVELQEEIKKLQHLFDYQSNEDTNTILD